MTPPTAEQYGQNKQARHQDARGHQEGPLLRLVGFVCLVLLIYALLARTLP